MNVIQPIFQRSILYLLPAVMLAALYLGGCESKQRDDNPPPPITSEPVSRSAATLAAASMLNKASFGPTNQSIQEVIAAGGTAAWIDDQIALPASLQLPYVQQNSNGSESSARHSVFMANAMTAPDQLRQRVAFAWSEFFVVSDLDYSLSNSQYGMASYYDMLTNLAFANYRDLLEAVTLHPVMGIYLSMVRNEKADPARNIRPDENYAREVLQLFSIGLHRLDDSGQITPAGNPQPVYSQQTVENFARVFTGWNFANTDKWESPDLTPFDKINNMVPVETYHDRDAKELLDGALAEAGLDAREDMQRALDNIFMHPNVGPFVSRHLIQRLVSSNPTADYVRRVASIFNDNGSGVRGDLASVIKAVLLDTEASTVGNNSGKLKEPLLRLTHLLRAFSAIPGADADNVYHGSIRTSDRFDEVYGQAVMSSPSVFNFFPPDYATRRRTTDANGNLLLAPELALMTEANVASANNDFHQLIYSFNNRTGRNGRASIIRLDQAVQQLMQDPVAYIDWLDVVVLAGNMSDALRIELLGHIESLGGIDTSMPPATDDVQSGNSATTQTDEETETITETIAETLVLDTLYLTTAAPDFYIQ